MAWSGLLEVERYQMRSTYTLATIEPPSVSSSIGFDINVRDVETDHPGLPITKVNLSFTGVETGFAGLVDHEDSSELLVGFPPEQLQTFFYALQEGHEVVFFLFVDDQSNIRTFSVMASRPPVDTDPRERLAAMQQWLDPTARAGPLNAPPS
jgi:hypothetical protein